MKNLLGAAVLLLASSPLWATNPCDVSEKACEQWNAYLKAQEQFRNRPRPAYELPPRYTGKYDDCPDGKELDGRGIEASIAFKDTGKTVVVKLAPASCRFEYPREDPDAPFTRREYQSQDGAWIGVYSSKDRPTSTISLGLGDASDSATLIPAFKTADLASGKDVDLGEVLLVKLDKGGKDGKVIPIKLVIRSVAP